MPPLPSATVTNARTLTLLDRIGGAWGGESRTRVIDRLVEREVMRMEERGEIPCESEAVAKS